MAEHTPTDPSPTASSPTDPSPQAPLVPATDARLVLSTAPPDVAHDVARVLVDEGLAACVSVVPGLRSVYRWAGAVQDDPESLLLVKTRADRLGALVTRLAEIHPYDVPEVLVLGPESGSPAWLAWLAEASAGPSRRPA
jgi:periplasmic divalent cation tolerance protein